MTKRTLLFMPLLLVLAIVAFLALQLAKSDNISPTEDWRGKPFPEFELKSLDDPNLKLNKADFPKEPFILNVWGSWCSWCIKEFPMLLKLQQQGVKIVGLTYNDRPEDARQALQKWGNPFEWVIDDYPQNFLVNTLKIQIAPTSYLIDSKGVVRYQQKGYTEDLEKNILPRWQALQEEK